MAPPHAFIQEQISTCSAKSSMLVPAAKATISKRSGFSATICSVWVPMLPVLPSNENRCSSAGTSLSSGLQRNLMANAKSHACRLLHIVLGNPLEEHAWTAGQLVNQVALTWHPHEHLLNNSQKLKRRLSRKRRHHLWARSSRLCWRHSSTGPRRGRTKGAVARLRSNLDDSFTPGMPLQRRRKPQLGMARLRMHALQL